ncbi:MAG TPA: hypothetical protein DDZ89_06275 [Clostridiales bacterium]|nr:hypothetical protein [Clostridiales bacterium]
MDKIKADAGILTEEQKTVPIPVKRENVECIDEPALEDYQTEQKAGMKWSFTLPVILLLFVAIRFIFDADMFLSDLTRLISIVSFLIWGFAIAYSLDPLVTFFMNKVLHKMKKGKRGLAMLFAYIIFFGIIAFLSVFILPIVGENIIYIASKVPEYWNNIQKWWAGIGESLSDDSIVNHYVLATGERINKLLSDYFNSSDFNRQLKDLGTGILNTALGATQFLINFILALVMSIYMLGDKKNMMRETKRITYAVFKKKTADNLVFATAKTNEIFKKFFLGKGLASVIVGVVTFIFATIIKLPVPLLQAFIIGVTNIIPTIGPVIGAIPCLLLTLFFSPVKAFWLLIFILILQQFDGMYMSPKILGDTLGLKPLFVIVGVLIGGSIAGIIGALLGTPTLAVISFFIKRYTDKRLQEKRLEI